MVGICSARQCAGKVITDAQPFAKRGKLSHIQEKDNRHTHAHGHTYPANEIWVLWPFAVSRGMLLLSVCLVAISCWLIYIFLVIKMCLYSTQPHSVAPIERSWGGNSFT